MILRRKLKRDILNLKCLTQIAKKVYLGDAMSSTCMCKPSNPRGRQLQADW